MAKPDKVAKRKLNHAAKSEALAQEADTGRKSWPIPPTGVVVRIKSSARIGSNLHLYLEAKKAGVDLIHDDHFIFVNPPLIHKGEANTRKALEAIVNDAVMGQIGHKL